MANSYLKPVLLLFFIFLNFFIYGQADEPYLIANNQEQFLNGFLSIKKSDKTSIQIAANETLSVKFNVKQNNKQGTTLIGNVNENPLSTISLRKIEGKLSGTIILSDTKKAYSVYAEGDKVYVQTQDIHNVICSDYIKATDDKKEVLTKASSLNANLLESYPGGVGVIYLDFDGEIVEGTDWKGGARIEAVSPNFSDEKITKIWQIMAEDFRPFKFNVTTNRAIFEAAPVNRRMMCIFTPTNDAAPDSGGVAWVNSFSASGSFGQNPCWIFNLGTRTAGETGSHEVGHTLGLLHDGTPGDEYYSGHGNWSPIMGWGASRAPSQWSIGEYPQASNQEDDVAIISGNRNGVGYKSDDHDGGILNATPLTTSTDGNVSAANNFGLIEQRSDIDMFSFNIETGNVLLNVNPNPNYPNLNIHARILNAVGTEVAKSDLSGLNSTLNVDLPEGDYYLEIDGVGSGNLVTGYSDYGSLGSYSISGKYILGDNSQPPIANFQASTNCGTVQFQDASTNLVVSYLWDFGDDTTSTERNPTHTYANNGNYTVSLKVTNNSGENIEVRNDFITIAIPNQPQAVDQSICANESASLVGTGSTNYRWYDAAIGGSLIHTGATLTLASVSTSKTYYLEGFSDNCINTNRTPVQVIVVPKPDEPIITILNEKQLSVTANEHSYTWYFNGVIIEGANTHTHLPESIGEYKVDVSNEAGCIITSKNYNVDLSQLNLSQDTYVFKYYPNPTKDILTIEGLTYREKRLSLVNTNGQTIFDGVPFPEMNFSALSNGVYFLIINKTTVGKLIKE